jgi:hypothetical protein
MIKMNPRAIIALGFFLVLLGFLLPFLMVMHIIESSFFMNFFSYAASLTGLLLGLIGVAWYTRSHRK